ncbi:MAG: Peptidoglycan D,D-transpeptidase MrdA [Flavobacteriia bacterium]|nr:MAG: Peptidoglycan D,D-transpeptidase MrdA [Flavobacteriia bacterium]
MNKALIVFLFFGLTCALFIGRLFDLQILDDKYTLYANENVIRKERIYAPRGHIYDRNGKLLVSNIPAYDLMVTPAKTAAFDTVFLARLSSVAPSDLRFQLKKARRYSSYRPSAVIRQISARSFGSLQEHLHRFPGFYMQKRAQRSYAHAGAAHALGYIGEVTEGFARKNVRYRMGDLHGVSGIEKAYEEQLRGRSGARYIMVDVHNREQNTFAEGAYDTLAAPGMDIRSTLDIDLQLLGEELMTNKRGSIVAIEPNSGEILALISSPTFDPARMVGRKRSAEYTRLLQDSLNKPLFDRAVLAEYPPGSPFKLINALIGLQEQVIRPSSSFSCRNGFHAKGLHVACHCGTDRPVALRLSISKSCNNYYCQVFKKIVDKYPSAQEGLDVWSTHVRSFGLGDFLNNDLPTGRRGFVPNADYYDQALGYTGWGATTTISLGIGQGELVLTPIQMANMSAAIANRGHYFTPHIVKLIGNEANEKFLEKKPTSIDPKHFDEVIEGMYEVFETGTARAARHDSIAMCGKTGTAQNPHGQDHSIFIAFAPKEDPKIALSIIVENGYWGSRWAAPIASLMMEHYLTGEIGRTALKERMIQGDLRAEYGLLATEENQQ